LEPLTEVFDHFDMETNRGARVAVREQILNERDENYAKVVGSDSLKRNSALEDLLEHGETRNTLIIQHSATLPYPPSCCQIQSKTRPTEISPFHNYDLSIFPTFPDALEVRPGPKGNIFTAKPGELRQAQAGLHGHQQQGVIASADPVLAVYSSKQRIDFCSRQEPDQWALAAFVGYRQYPLDHAALLRGFQCNESKE
jgi:hypothetical protein